MGVEEEGTALRPGMTEAFFEQPAEGRAPVGEGGGAELADRVGGGVALPTCHELGPLPNPLHSNQQALKLHLQALASGWLPLWLRCAGTLFEDRNGV